MKRRYKRLQLNCPAIVTVHPGTRERRIYLLRVANISTAGAMFLSEIRLAVNTPVQVYLHLEIGQEKEKKTFRVRFSGKVVRTEPGGFAVEFDEAQQSLMVQDGTPTA
jgi:PilZ domain